MRTRLLLLGVVLVVVVVGCVGVGWSQLRASQAQQTRPPTVAVAAAPTGPDAVRPSGLTGPRIVFRHTGLDQEHGVVAAVPLDDPSGPRTFTDLVCDRVDTSAGTTSCLATERGVVTRFTSTTYDDAGSVVDSAPLPGVPSRTRVSPDGSLVATTSFVTGHSYAATGFSTATAVRHVGGEDLGDLERFALVIGGERVRPADRNVWGVTFVDDETVFATVATGGTTYLVRGDLAARTLTAVADGVECPSVSPDGTRVAFKQVTGTGPTRWTPAVLDLATGGRVVLGGEARSVDDQLEWLDDDTVLYGVPRPDEPGVTDVWALDTTPGAVPEVLVEQAWSPSVVR